MCISSLIYSHPRPFSGWTLQWIASWNACHFRWFISQGSQYHKHSYRGGGWGMVESHEVAGPSNSKKFIRPNGIKSGCFWLHISQNVATLMPSLTSQSCGDSVPAVCLAGQVGANYRPPKYPWTPDRPVNELSLSKSRSLNLWQWYKHELLVYCCICRMAVKSETWNCVRTRPLLANLVTCVRIK